MWTGEQKSRILIQHKNALSDLVFLSLNFSRSVFVSIFLFFYFGWVFFLTFSLFLVFSFPVPVFFLCFLLESPECCLTG